MRLGKGMNKTIVDKIETMKVYHLKCEKEEEEWKIKLEKNLIPAIKEVDVDSESRQFPDSFIRKDKTVERQE